jgi:hypothetical protein
MKDWINTLWEAAIFKTDAYERVAERRDAFFLGFVTIVAIALIIGIPSFITGLINTVSPAPSAAEVQTALDDIEQTFNQFAPFMGDVPPEMRTMILAQINQVAELAIETGRQLDALPRPLPKPIGGIFESFGRYTSQPFADARPPLTAVTLGTWLGYGIWVMLFAKLLGGRGGLVSFFGTTALWAGPFLLTFFRFIPVLGAFLSLIAFIWGLVIYVKATAVSHRFSGGRATVAAFLPMLLLLLLGLLFAGSIGALIGLANMGN